MEKKTLLVGGVTTIVVLVLLTVWRGVALNQRADELQLAGGVFATVQEIGGTKYLVPLGEIYSLGLTARDVPALQNPTFTSVANADAVLADELYGIALTVDDVDRFYPVQVLNWHQVVNDNVNGRKITVTYDPLTGSAAVFDADNRTFAISGKVYNNNVLMEDTDGNLWQQIRGQAVVGDAAGDMLTPYPFQVYRWVDWKADHPGGESLDFSTGFARDYRRHPYGGYEADDGIFFPLNFVATPMPSKWTVDTVVMNGEAVAFAREGNAIDHVMSDTVGGTPLVTFFDDERSVNNVFAATAGDRVLTFAYDTNDEVITDNETGSTWSADGKALAGELLGTQLALVNAPEAYWFAWAAAYPTTKYPGIDPTDAPTN